MTCYRHNITTVDTLDAREGLTGYACYPKVLVTDCSSAICQICSEELVSPLISLKMGAHLFPYPFISIIEKDAFKKSTTFCKTGI